MKLTKINSTVDLNTIIEDLSDTGLDATGLHGVLSMMGCLFSGDEPTEKTMVDAIFWLCNQVQRMEKDIDMACTELSQLRRELEKAGKDGDQRTA